MTCSTSTHGGFRNFRTKKNFFGVDDNDISLITKRMMIRSYLNTDLKHRGDIEPI